MHARRLTISSRYPEIRARRAEYVRPMPMPFLRLQGCWLDKAGFLIGAQVRVEVDRGRLVAEVIDAAATPRRSAARYATHPDRGQGSIYDSSLSICPFGSFKNRLATM